MKKLIISGLIAIIFTLMFPIKSNANTIIETTTISTEYDLIERYSTIIGVTKFDPSIIITSNMASTAGYNDAIFQVQSGIIPSVPKVYVYNGPVAGWYEIQDDGTAKKMPIGFTKKDIYFVNNVEKKIDIKYEGTSPIDVSTLPSNVTYNSTTKLFGVPAKNDNFTVPLINGQEIFFDLNLKNITNSNNIINEPTITYVPYSFEELNVVYQNGNSFDSTKMDLLDNGSEQKIIKFKLENRNLIYPYNVTIRWDNLVNNVCQYESNGVCTNSNSDTYVGNQLTSVIYNCADYDSYKNFTGSCLMLNSDSIPQTGNETKLHFSDSLPITKSYVEDDEIIPTVQYYVVVITKSAEFVNADYQQGKKATGNITIDYHFDSLGDYVNRYTEVKSDFASEIDFKYTDEIETGGCDNSDPYNLCPEFDGLNENVSAKFGLFKNELDNIINDPTKNKIHYFRGKNVINYLYFGNYANDLYISHTDSSVYNNLSTCEMDNETGNCDLYVKSGDPILWRIMSVNNNNELKLITEKSVISFGNYAYNSNLDINPLVAYTYGDTNTDRTDGNMGTSSRLKNALDVWYRDNLLSKASYIKQDADYCNDSTIAGNEGDYSFYNAFKRNSGSVLNHIYTTNESITPTFSCPTTDKTYGGLYKAPIGTLTVDEYIYSGGYSYAASTILKNPLGITSPSPNTYLRNNTSFWTMSPAYINPTLLNAKVFTIGNDGGLKMTETTDNNQRVQARAVITLKGNVTGYGFGTLSHPFYVTGLLPEEN